MIIPSVYSAFTSSSLIFTAVLKLYLKDVSATEMGAAIQADSKLSADLQAKVLRIREKRKVDLSIQEIEDDDEAPEIENIQGSGEFLS